MNAPLLKKTVGSAHPTKLPIRLRQFMNAYWLRPENAFWMTLRSLTLSGHEFVSPSIDVSCGDGVFSFIHAGGTFEPSFDVFRAVAGLDNVTNTNADMFDHASDDYAPAIATRSATTIDVGTDLKRTLLKKAAALDFYQRLVQHDNNNRLPFDDESLMTVYCNCAYWVERIDFFLADLARITQRKGRIVLHVKLDSMRRYTLDAHRAKLGDRFLSIIGRGRFDTWPSLASQREWERRFAHAGLTIVEATPFITKTHSHIWDVGLRPIAPLLVRMANNLTPKTRESIKHDWVDLCCELFEPICRGDFDLFDKQDEPAEMQYVLETRN